MRQYPIGNGTVSARIPKECAALLEALQCNGANPDGLLALNDTEWKWLLDFADVAHLALPLAQRLDEASPAWVIDRLSRNVHDNERRFERVYAAYCEAAEALERSGVPYVVLKGFTQIPDFIADPRMRMQSDIDIYCPPDTLEAGHEALRAIGYQPKLDIDYRWADHSPTLIRPGSWKWRGNSYDPEMPPSIELHFCLWNEKTSFMALPEVEQFWTRRIEDKFRNYSWHSLQDIDKLGYLALHILRGIIAGDWVVHHVYELASFMQRRSQDVEFWNRWSISHGAQLRNTQAIALWLARSWFSCQVPAQVIETIESLPAAQLVWCQRFGGSPLDGMFSTKKDGRLLQLLLTRRGPARLAILRRTLLPTSVAGPKKAAAHFNRRMPPRSGKTRLHRSYLAYLCKRSFAYLRGDIELLWHTASIWLAGRKLSKEFWTFLGACFFFDLGLSIYYFLFNIFLNARGYSEQQLGMIGSAMAAGSFAGALPAQITIRRLGVRNALLACVLSLPAILTARALATAFSLQMGLAVFAGLAFSLWAVCLSPMTASLVDEESRPRAFSYLFSVGIGLGAIGGVAGSRMPEWIHHFSKTSGAVSGERWTLIASCCIAAIGLPFVACLPDIRTECSPKRRPFLSPNLGRFLLGVAGWSFVTGSFSPFANIFFIQHVGMSLSAAGYLFSASQLFQVAAVLAAPHLFRKIGLVNGITCAQWLACACLIAIGVSHHPAFAACGFVLLTAAQWMNEPGLYSIAMSITPEEHRSGASASMALVIGGTQMVAAALAGWAFSHIGYPRSLGAIAVISAVAGLIFQLFKGLTRFQRSETTLVLNSTPEANSPEL